MPYPPDPEITTPVRIAVESLITNMLTTIRDQRTSGIADSVIATGLQTSFGDNAGGLGVLRAAIRERAQAVQQHAYGRGQFQAETARVGGDPAKQPYMWNAVGRMTCVDCTQRHGRVRTYEEWQKLGLPGRAPTKCRFRCRCVLMPASRALELYGADNVVELTAKARRPIVVRRAAIAAQEAERGQRFADSTVAAKVGEFREPDAPRVVSAAGQVTSRNPDVALAREADRRFREAGRDPNDPEDVGNLDYGSMINVVLRDFRRDGRVVDGQLVD